MITRYGVKAPVKDRADASVRRLHLDHFVITSSNASNREHSKPSEQLDDSALDSAKVYHSSPRLFPVKNIVMLLVPHRGSPAVADAVAATPAVSFCHKQASPKHGLTCEVPREWLINIISFNVKNVIILTLSNNSPGHPQSSFFKRRGCIITGRLFFLRYVAIPCMLQHSCIFVHLLVPVCMLRGHGGTCNLWCAARV